MSHKIHTNERILPDVSLYFILAANQDDGGISVLRKNTYMWAIKNVGIKQL